MDALEQKHRCLENKSCMRRIVSLIKVYTAAICEITRVAEVHTQSLIVVAGPDIVGMYFLSVAKYCTRQYAHLQRLFEKQPAFESIRIARETPKKAVPASDDTVGVTHFVT